MIDAMPNPLPDEECALRPLCLLLILVLVLAMMDDGLSEIEARRG